MLFSIKFAALSAFIATTIVNANADTFNLKSRDVFDPTITQPDAETTWTAGVNYNVTWDTSNAPASISNEGLVTLELSTYGPEILAEGFNLRAGWETITIPANCAEGNDYKITLFGDSGNQSPEFTINAA